MRLNMIKYVLYLLITAIHSLGFTREALLERSFSNILILLLRETTTTQYLLTSSVY